MLPCSQEKKILAHTRVSAQTCVHQGENINQRNNDAHPFISILEIAKAVYTFREYLKQYLTVQYNRSPAVINIP